MKKKEEKDGWWGFCQLTEKAVGAGQLHDLFDCFLTIEEREMLTSRYLIVQELLKGELKQREIAHKLGVSIAQITRGSNQLKTIRPTLKEFLLRQLT